LIERFKPQEKQQEGNKKATRSKQPKSTGPRELSV
jgi:hypothetical protein